MKKILSLFLVSISCSLNAQQLFSSKMEKEDITKVCNAVSEWQITHHNEVKHNPLDWTNGALYRGMTEWGKVSGNQSCYDFVRTIGEKHKWNMWDRVYHADDICVGQAFIEMYRRFDDKRMLQPVMERAYYVASHPSKATLQKTDAIGTTERWSWSDALFMAPPVYAALYTITGDKIYLNYMDSEYKECVDSLYDKEDHLFYRDNKRIPLREKMVVNNSGEEAMVGYLPAFLSLSIIYLSTALHVTTISGYLQKWQKQFARLNAKTGIGVPAY